ncbi:MAG TPA: hypothetical protein VFO71_06905 [Gemmatimonadales bacterium]|nr:hypothetical protein [Gemmatimonadales bacterium]
MTAGTREVRLEELLGRVVRSAAGRPIGVIQDMRAQPHGDEYLIHEVLVGELGIMSKLLGMLQQLPTFRALGLGRPYRSRPVPWNWLDLSDPAKPRFRASVRQKEVQDE